MKRTRTQRTERKYHPGDRAAKQERLAEEFVRGTGYATPHEAISAGVRTLDEWLTLVDETREYPT